MTIAAAMKRVAPLAVGELGRVVPLRERHARDAWASDVSQLVETLPQSIDFKQTEVRDWLKQAGWPAATLQRMQAQADRSPEGALRAIWAAADRMTHGDARRRSAALRELFARIGVPDVLSEPEIDEREATREAARQPFSDGQIELLHDMIADGVATKADVAALDRKYSVVDPTVEQMHGELVSLVRRAIRSGRRVGERWLEDFPELRSEAETVAAKKKPAKKKPVRKAPAKKPKARKPAKQPAKPAARKPAKKKPVKKPEPKKKPAPAKPKPKSARRASASMPMPIKGTASVPMKGNCKVEFGAGAGGEPDRVRYQIDKTAAELERDRALESVRARPRTDALRELEARMLDHVKLALDAARGGSAEAGRPHANVVAGIAAAIARLHPAGDVARGAKTGQYPARLQPLGELGRITQH